MQAKEKKPKTEKNKKETEKKQLKTDYEIIFKSIRFLVISFRVNEFDAALIFHFFLLLVR